MPSLSPVICDSSEVGPLSVSGVPGYATGAVHPLQDTLPTSAVSELLQEFGPNVFVLWKLALLQKRILFCSSPPIGRTCLLGELNKSKHMQPPRKVWLVVTPSLCVCVCTCSEVHLPDDYLA